MMRNDATGEEEIMRRGKRSAVVVNEAANVPTKLGNVDEAIASLYQPYIDICTTRVTESFVNNPHLNSLRSSILKNLKRRLRPLIYSMLDKELELYRKALIIREITTINNENQAISDLKVLSELEGAYVDGVLNKDEIKQLFKNKINVPNELEVEQRHGVARRLFNERKNSFIRGLTAERAQEQFMNFVEQYNNTFAFLLWNKYQSLSNLARDATIAYADSLHLLSQRLRTDENMLKKFFEVTSNHNNSVTSLILADISSTNSDPHHGGQQVLILTFDVNDTAQRLVYKPRAVVIDANITGCTDKLARVLGQPVDKSFFELLNEYDEATKLKYPLPTYLIVPCCDNSQDESYLNDINNAYGYVEYLPHSPWHNIDVDSEAKAFFIKYPPSQRSNLLGEFQKQINSIIDNAILAGSNNIPGCDYITDKYEDVQRYSYLCGAYTAAMLALKMTDMHYENVIIHGKQPYLIDLEVSMNQSVTELNNTGAFDTQTGAFTVTTKSLVQCQYILDVTGIHFSEHEEFERNISFVCETKVQNCLWFCRPQQVAMPEPCQHDEEYLKQGLVDATNVILNNKNKINIFVNKLEQTPLRVVPIATSELVGFRDSYIQLHLENEFNEAEFSQFVKKERFNKLLSRSVNDEHNQELKFLAYAESCFSSEFKLLSIPSFYLRANGVQLLDSTGTIISHPANIEYYVADSYKNENNRSKIANTLETLPKNDGIICYYRSGASVYVVDGIMAMNEDTAAQVLASFTKYFPMYTVYDADLASRDKKSSKARNKCVIC